MAKAAYLGLLLVLQPRVRVGEPQRMSHLSQQEAEISPAALLCVTQPLNGFKKNNTINSGALTSGNPLGV